MQITAGQERKKKMPSKFKLSGLSHNNLLAFLTLVGTMKLLDSTRPDWSPRAAWRDHLPTIYVDADIKQEQFLDAILEGLKEFGNRMGHIKQKNMKIEVEEFAKLQREADPGIVAALGSDGASKMDNKKEIVEYTPLCMILGSGHQYFLERLRNATHVKEDQQVIQEVKDALFSEWYSDSNSADKSDKKITFRWDPQEYRPHAYRNKDPSGDAVMPVNGANRLAAVGFTVYDCVPTKHGLCTASHRVPEKKKVQMEKESDASKEAIFWPIWNMRLSLASVLALMHYPYVEQIADMKNDKAHQKLDAYGVECIMGAEMFWEGKYKNVRIAERVL